MRFLPQPLKSHGLNILIQLLLGVTLAVIPIIRIGGYKGVLLIGLFTSLLHPIFWLARRETFDGGQLTRRFALYMGIGLIPFTINLIAALTLTAACKVDDGLGMLLVGHAPGLLVTFGIVEALEATGVRFKGLIHGLLWLALLVAGGWWFLNEPVYQATHLMAGMLLGPPNESHDPLIPRAFWFALEMISWATALIAAATAARLHRADPPHPRRWLAVGLATAAGVVALTLVTLSPDLGYRINTRVMQEALSVDIESSGIHHHMPPLLPTDARPWIVLEAEFQRDRQLRLLGLDDETMPPATIFWYRDRRQKKELTGAARTKFAKVHRGELYVSAEVFPPRTVGHELAHVTSKRYNHNWPLRVPGYLGGAWYNPALVEGFAVAVDWSDFPLSSHEQARIAKDRDRLPALESLFDPIGFATTNLSVAYRASGSFMRFCMDTYGVEQTLAFYGSEDFEASFGMPLGEAERAWHAMLDEIELRPQDVARVESAQSLPSIAKEACGRSEVDIELAEAIRVEADDTVARILADSEPVDDKSEARLWFLEQRYKAARADYDCTLPPEPEVELSEKDTTRYIYIRALTHWARGERAEAEALLGSMPSKNRNTNDVIIARIMIRDGFALEDLRPPASVSALQTWVRLFERDQHPIIGHAIAEKHTQNQRWDSADAVARNIDFHGFDFPDGLTGTLLLSTHQKQAKAAFVRRDFKGARAAYTRYMKVANTEGRRVNGRTWLERIDFFEERQDRLKADLPRL